MASNLPFIHLNSQPGSAEPDALLGFSLPYLPDMLTSRWLTGSNEQDRLCEALRLQIRLINTFWSSGVTAWDLRFIGIDELPGVAIGLLCRLHRLPQVPFQQFLDFCLDRAMYIQQAFANFGYELVPLEDESSFTRYQAPFRFEGVAELRRYEELLALVSAYNEYEVYVTYPWHWAVQNRLRLLEALLFRQSNCLVSVYLEPTQLSFQEQNHLNHATSLQIRNLLLSSGSPEGQMVYNTYMDYARSLRQPYLLRIGLAASTPQAVEHIGRIFQDELNTAQVLDPVGRALLDEIGASRVSGMGPVLEYPHTQEEWQKACHSLLNLEWIPWGYNRGMDFPGTARLRYLVDDIRASMAFRLPVAHEGDIPGIPVRSRERTLSKSAIVTNTNPSSTPTFAITSPLFSTSTSTRPSRLLPTEVDKIQKSEDLIGKTLGTCKIEALIGQGGFGAVYCARQPHLDRQVAVKVVLASISKLDHQKSRKMILRFDREAQAIARLDHPHILALYEYQAEPIPYLVMPYLVGGSLAEELKSSGHRPLPAKGVAIILRQVASALDHAHQQQLVHRDVKPDNLLRHRDGRILLSDFGIVQFEDDNLTVLTTEKQSSPYTPAYASPEQHQGQRIDYRSDIYSLAIIIYELLCGDRPFKQAYEHVYSPVPPMQTFGVQVHPALESVVEKALAKQPEQRYRSAGEMAAEFQRALLGG